MICRFCHNLDPRGHEDSVQIGSPAQSSELIILREFLDTVQAALDGCRFCKLLCAMILHFVPDLPDSMPKPVLQLILREGFATNVTVGGLDLSQVPRRVRFVAAFHFYNPTHERISDLPSLGTLGLYSHRADTDQCFQFIKGSLQQCIQSHHRCDQSTSKAFPKRVLSIGLLSSDNIKIIEPGLAYGKYATLSHCWGGHQPLRSTKESIEDMKRSICWNNLPPVFQDAINIARKLHIRWIWIDSLCIIQDCNLDWEIESSKMGDYYRNSHVTIAAASSNNGSIAFIKERERLWWPKRFWLADSNGTKVSIYARRYQAGLMATEEPFGQLATRGWTFQETLLSPRILHYTEAELMWECRTQSFSEDGANLGHRCYVSFPETFLSCAKDPYHFWMGVVHFYSLRHLSFASDKLPAISGAASMVQEATGSDYLAGLWKGDLLNGLCWMRGYELGASHSPQVQPENYIAPSWSWASIDGAVSFKDLCSSFQSIVKVVDVQCTTLGHNPFGKVTDGSITLHGPIAETTLNCKNPYDYWAYKLSTAQGLDLANTFFPDTLLVNSDDRVPAVKRAKKEDKLVPFQGRVYCLFLGSVIIEDHDEHTRVPSLFGLVLSKLHTADNEYVRLGLVVVNTNNAPNGIATKTVTIV